MKMVFGLGTGRNERIHEIADIARVAEEQGFDHITLVDQPFMSRDVHVGATLAAANTRYIRIGHGVADPVTFHPMTLANATATLDELARGRVFMGVGAGGPFGKMMTAPMRHRNYREALLFMKKFMAGEEASYQGTRVRSEWIRGPVPLYIAAEGPLSLQLAGELGDGVMTMGAPPAWIKWKLEFIEKGALKAGRDPSKIDVLIRCMMTLAETKEAGRELAKGTMHFYYEYLEAHRNYPEAVKIIDGLEREQPGLLDEMKRYSEAWDPVWFEHNDAQRTGLVTSRMVDNFSLTGTPDDVHEGIHKLHEVGVKNISVVIHTVKDKKGQLREIGEKIIPEYRYGDVGTFYREDQERTSMT